MSVKLITYDLNKPGQKHDKVLETIKAYRHRQQLSESSYAVDTTETVDQIWARFSGFIDGNDRFLVIPLKGPHQGWAPEKLHDWLNERL